MKINSLLLFNALIYIALGIAFALYGPVMIALFGVHATGGDGVIYWYVASFARLFGAALFGFGFLLWALRGMVESSQPGSAQRRSFLMALLFANLIGLIVSLTQQSSVWLSPAGWALSGLFLVFCAGYGYILLMVR